MTVITRCENQGIVIGGDLSVTVLEVHTDHVRLGFTCSSRTPSYWEETLAVMADEAVELEDEETEVSRFFEPREVFLEA